MLPDPIKKFVDAFSGLPGIGPRQATRLAFYIKSLGASTIGEIANAIYGLNNIKICEQCFSGYEIRKDYENTKNICGICSNPQRRKDIIAIVEKETDLISLEKTKKFTGRYLVLGDLKKTGILDTMQKLRLQSLKKQISSSVIVPARQSLGDGGRSESDEAISIDRHDPTAIGSRDDNKSGIAEEIILAINPTTYGDINADLIVNELKNHAQKITRLGRGIPTGGEIEFADEETLGGAMDNRR